MSPITAGSVSPTAGSLSPAYTTTAGTTPPVATAALTMVPIPLTEVKIETIDHETMPPESSSL